MPVGVTDTGHQSVSVRSLPATLHSMVSKVDYIRIYCVFDINLMIFIHILRYVMYSQSIIKYGSI